MVGAGFPDEDTSIDESLPHVSSIVEATKETEVGITVGDGLGASVGALVGEGVACRCGLTVGSGVGMGVGGFVGAGVGGGVGATRAACTCDAGSL